MDNKSVLVIGANGLLGSDLMKVLEQRGIPAIGADCTVTKRPDLVKVDIRDFSDVEGIVRDIKPTHVINAAAFTDVDGCETNPNYAFTVNARGAVNIARACDINVVEHIYISTDYVFNGQKEGPWNEYDIPAPVNVYGQSKYAGELESMYFCFATYVVRTSWMFGRKGANFVEAIIKKMKDSGSIRVVSDQMGSPTYSLDLAKGIVSNFVKGLPLPYGTYHLTNSGFCSWFDFAQEIKKFDKPLDIKTLIKVEPMLSCDLDRPAVRPKNSVLDNLKLRVYGCGPMRSWQDALHSYILEGRTDE